MKILNTTRHIIKFANKGALEFIIKGFLLTDKSWIINTIKTIEMCYDFLDKQRILLEKKNFKERLVAQHNVSEGTLIKVLRDLEVCRNITNDKRKTTWLKIPAGSIMMFLDVEHDPQFDALVLKVLCEQKLYLVYKNSNFKNYNNNFNDKFYVLS